MILIILTTEGGSREDGNVYYASHLLCKAHESDLDAISNTIAVFTHGKVEVHDGPIVMCPTWKEDESDNDEFDPQKIAARLDEAGWPTEVVTNALLVVQDVSYKS